MSISSKMWEEIVFKVMSLFSLYIGWIPGRLTLHASQLVWALSSLHASCESLITWKRRRTEIRYLIFNYRLAGRRRNDLRGAALRFKLWFASGFWWRLLRTNFVLSKFISNPDRSRSTPEQQTLPSPLWLTPRLRSGLGGCLCPAGHLICILKRLFIAYLLRWIKTNFLARPDFRRRWFKVHSVFAVSDTL